MSPSCANGLSRVGFAPELHSATNTPLTTIKNLTAGRLAKSQPGAEYRFSPDVGDGTLEQTLLPKVEVHLSSGKGLGLFAVDDIPAYSRILEDFALLSLAPGEDVPELWQKYSVLPSEEKRQFDELGFSSNQADREENLILKLKDRGYGDEAARKMVRVSSRFMANAFKENDSDRWKATLFLTVARINHSCTPNAQTHYRPASGAKLLYSFRDIKAGEEIEISYFGITQAYADRQSRAKSWGFTCACPACSSTGILRNDKYERVLAQIRIALEIGLDVSNHQQPAEESIKGIRSAIEAALNMEYPWLVAALPNLYLYLAAWLGREARYRRATEAALQSALEWESKITGPDSLFSEDKRRRLERLTESPDG